MTLSVRDYNPSDPQDAERLAAMFNTWDSVWPGGFTRGVPETAQRIREYMARRRQLAVCVVEDTDTGALVGHCNLEAQTGQTEIAYVPLLGANPDYHGRGVGKMLLREIVRRVTALNFQQVTLGTWPGNLKAVPLYKKTGFMWEPDTSVHMVNFIPAILNSPQGKAFFADRDWYACFDRELNVAPDDVTWQGMKVYAYRFSDGKDVLNVTLDAAGGRVTAIETNEYAVGCSIGANEAPAGETVPIRWEIAPGKPNENKAEKNYDGSPLTVVLLAEAEPGLDLRVQESLTLTGPTVIERELRIRPDTQPARQGQTPPRVRTTLIIGGQPVTLESGVKVTRPVEIEYNGQSLLPNRPTRITVSVRNRTARDLTGTLALDPRPGLNVADSAPPITIPANGWAECEYDVTALSSGVAASQLRLETDSLTYARPVAFRVWRQQAALGWLDAYNEKAILQSPDLRLDFQLRGGGFEIHASDSRLGYGQQRLGEVGPPFGGHRASPPLLDARLETAPDGSDVLTMIAPALDFPGLVVERSVAFVAPTIIKITHRVANRANHAQPAQFRLASTAWRTQTVAAPLPSGESGIIREPVFGWGDFPSGDTDLLPLDRTFNEQWLACEQDGTVCGLVWHPGAKEDMQWSQFPNLTVDLGELPPHSVHELAPVYYVCGRGDWQTVRDEWKRRVRPSVVGEDLTPKPKRVLTVITAPTTPAFLCDKKDAVQLLVQNRRGNALDGTLTVGTTKDTKEREEQTTGDTGKERRAVQRSALSAQHSVLPGRFELAGVNRDKAFTAELRVTGLESPGAVLLNARLEAGPSVERFTIPVVHVGGGTADALSVSEMDGGEYVIANGLLTLRVAPRFRGSLYALESDGVNHLFASYPEACALAWFNPWHGGVHTGMGYGTGDQSLARAHYDGRIIERVGKTGMEWRGAGVSCVPAHKDWNWLRMETDYVTTGGSNLVAVVQRFTNMAGATKNLYTSLEVWAQPGGTREHAVAHWERQGERRERRRGAFQAGQDTDGWGAIENTQSGHVLLACATGPDAQLNIMDFASEGAHPEPAYRFALAPGETKERLTWLVITRDRSQIAAYARLTECDTLP